MGMKLENDEVDFALNVMRSPDILGVSVKKLYGCNGHRGAGSDSLLATARSLGRRSHHRQTVCGPSQRHWRRTPERWPRRGSPRQPFAPDHRCSRMALGKAGDGVHRLLSQRRDDEARRQRVAGHTETPVVLGGGARQRDDAALRNAVDAAIVEGAE